MFKLKPVPAIRIHFYIFNLAGGPTRPASRPLPLIISYNLPRKIFRRKDFSIFVRSNAAFIKIKRSI